MLFYFLGKLAKLKHKKPDIYIDTAKIGAKVNYSYEEIQRRKKVVNFKQTDYERWSDPANFDPAWSGRFKWAADLAKDCKSVCDVGCGMQGLKNYLSKDQLYFPADLTKWSSDVEVCDLNAGKLPICSLCFCDCTVLLGVLEYVFDVKKLFFDLSKYSKTLIASYCPLDKKDNGREAFGWVNNFKESEFLDLLKEAGFQISKKVDVDDMQIIVRARKRLSVDMFFRKLFDGFLCLFKKL